MKKVRQSSQLKLINHTIPPAPIHPPENQQSPVKLKSNPWMSKLYSYDEMLKKQGRKNLTCINLQKEGWAEEKDFWNLVNLQLHSNWKDTADQNEKEKMQNARNLQNPTLKLSSVYLSPKHHVLIVIYENTIGIRSHKSRQPLEVMILHENRKTGLPKNISQ